MSKTHDEPGNHDESGLYQIRLKGHLDDRYSGRFEGLAITLEEDGHTLLAGQVIDQAALHGLLKQVRDLGMPLVSIGPVEPSSADASDLRIINRRTRLAYAKSFTQGE